MITFWKDNAEVRTWLEERALNHENSSVKTAIAQGITAIELPDINSEAVQSLGDVYYYQNRYEEAIAVYLDLNINAHLTPKIFLINAYTNLKRYDEAIACCNQWIEKEPKSQWTYNSLGDAYRESGRYGEAIAAYERAIELAGCGKSWKLLDCYSTVQRRSMASRKSSLCWNGVFNTRLFLS